MKRTYPEPLLNQPISTLEMSEVFKNLTLKNNLQTLADILNLPQIPYLLQYEGFNYRHPMELTVFLTANDLAYYLTPV